jgi:hypothetical protein
MGAKKTLPTYFPFIDAALAGTSTVKSIPTFIANLDNIGCQVIFTGTMVGNLTVNVSNDNINFDAITFSPLLPQPLGVDIRYAIDLNQVPWPYLQFSYTNISGAGTLSVSIFGKDLN